MWGKIVNVYSSSSSGHPLVRRTDTSEPYRTSVAPDSLINMLPQRLRSVPGADAEDPLQMRRTGIAARELENFDRLAQGVEVTPSTGGVTTPRDQQAGENEVLGSVENRGSPESAGLDMEQAEPLSLTPMTIMSAQDSEEFEDRKSIEIQLQVYEESIREGYRKIEERTRQLRVVQRLERIYQQFEDIQERQVREIKLIRQEMDLQQQVLQGRDESVWLSHRTHFQSHIRRLLGQHLLLQPGEPESPEEVLKRQEEKLQNQFNVQEQLKVEIKKLIDVHRTSLDLRRNEAQQRRDLIETSKLFDKLVARLPPEDRERAENTMRLIRRDWVTISLQPKIYDFVFNAKVKNRDKCLCFIEFLFSF